ncbi:hypothetical protein HDU86_008391 [Geranomyces michiganensis]|nr:hypothetical protein HDU86_008391 [Geranomyces michiganensis]
MGIPPDNFTLMCRAESLAYARDYDAARKIFCELRRAKAHELDAHAYAIAIRCEAAGGHVDAAEAIAGEMRQALIRPNRAACAALVQAYIAAQRDAEADALLDRLVADGAALDEDCLLLLVGLSLRRKSQVAAEIILRRMSSLGCLPNAVWHAEELRKMEEDNDLAGVDMLVRCARAAGISWSSTLYSAFAQAYARMGALGKAEELFTELSLAEKLEDAPNACKVMLLALCQGDGTDSGGVERAVQMIDGMGSSLDRECYEALLWFYGSAKNVNKAEDVIALMGSSGKRVHQLLIRLYARSGDMAMVASKVNEYVATFGIADLEMIGAVVDNWESSNRLGSQTISTSEDGSKACNALPTASVDVVPQDDAVTIMVTEWFQGRQSRDNDAYALLDNALHRAVVAGEHGRAVWLNDLFQHLAAAPTPGLFISFFDLCASHADPELDRIARSYFQWGDSLLAWIRIDNACRAKTIKLSRFTTKLFESRLRRAVEQAGFVDKMLEILTGKHSIELRDDTRGRILLIALRHDAAVGAHYISRAGAAALGSANDTRLAQLEVARDAPLNVAIACFDAFRSVGAPPFQSAASTFLGRLVDAGRQDDPRRLDDARKFFAQMRAAGDAGFTSQVSAESYNLMLEVAAEAKDPRAFNNLYSMMRKAGHSSNDKSRHCVIILHVSRGEMKAALNKLVSFRSKGAAIHAVTWGIVVEGFLKAGDEDGARKTIKMMRTAGVPPNVVVYTSLLKNSARTGNDAKVAETEALMRSEGVVPNAHTYSVLIDQAGKKGDAIRAKAIYDKMVAAGVRPVGHTITGLMKAYLQANDLTGALAAHAEFSRWDVPPDRKALDSVVRMKARIGDGDGALAAMRALPVTDNTRHSLWMGYARAGDATRASAAFVEWLDKLVDKSSVTILLYNYLLDCLARAGHARQAVEHFRVLLAAGLEPDSRTFHALIGAHAVAGDAEGVTRWWNTARDAPGIQLDEVVVTTVIDGLTKLNHDNAAIAILENAQQMGITLGERAFCPILEKAFARKDVDAAAAVLAMMRAAGIEPTVRTWSSVIAGLSYCGRYDEAWKVWLAVRGTASPSSAVTTNGPWAVHAPATREQLGQVAGPLRAILLDYCGYAGRPDRARKLWKAFANDDWGSPVEENHLASLVECLCRNQLLDAAVEVYSSQAAGSGLMDVKPGVKTIGTLLNFLFRAGRLQEAKNVISEMRRNCPWVEDLLVRKFVGLSLDLRNKGIILGAD